MMDKKNRRLFVLFLMLGLLFSYQARILSKGVKYVGVENLQESINLVETEKAEIALLRQALEADQEKIVLYDNPSDVNYDELLTSLEDRLTKLTTYLNFTDVEGPGVIVIVDDSERELYQGEDGNNVLVHNTDVGIIVDELRAAGAEAISINGERVVYNNTRIVCVGPTVTVNGEQMTAPFIIKAIGNRKYLEAAINAPGTFAEILASYGLFVEANTSISVEIGMFDGQLTNNYMKYYEEGEN